MKLSLSISFLLLAAPVFAQDVHRTCGAEIIKQHIAAQNANAAAQMVQTLEQNASYARQQMTSNAASKTTASANPIPVVFHIILNQLQITRLGGVAGIEQRIDSQLAVINRDFNKQNADGSSIPAAFQPLYGNVGISFGRAHRKPDGTSTPGYEIITTTENGFEESSTVGSGMGFASGKFVNGTTTAWDPTKYLNIWIMNLLDNGSTSSILGLTTPPSFNNYNIPGFSPNEQGVVLNYGAFGVKAASVTYFITGITAGRTLTHELGHYFEVWHVWGDDNGKCAGSGGQDDGISDTPPQSSATYGCPTYPQLDACTASGSGIMFMNFMDYVNDQCMFLFTNEQAKVMSTMVSSGKESYSLTQNPDLLQYPTSVAGVANANSSFNVYPNPSNGQVTVTATADVNSLQVTDITGRVLETMAINKTAGNYTLNLSQLPKGIYVVRSFTDNGNGTQKLVLQ